MCMMQPKVPKAPEPKLPPQPIRQTKAADFKPDDAAIGFGETGRTGGQRSLRIKRQRKQPKSMLGNLGTGLSIGTQVPGT
jgi:hypothetical protein